MNIDDKQPTDADSERPMTLIEKLEQKRDHHNHFLETCRNDRDKAYHSFGKKCYQEAIDIVKQHSDWISVDERLPTENDGRVSWGVNAYKKYILVNIVSRGIAMTCRFNLTDKCFETADKVTHWTPLPQPPSEVQDD